jgi:capsular polysaccharide biosynthesis protein
MDVKREYVTQETASVRDQLVLLWRSRVLVLSLTLAFGVVATIAAFLIPKEYEATTVLAPVSNAASGGQMGSLGSMASQFGGIAALAGISMPGEGGKAESVAELESENLTEAYIQKNDLLPVLYAKYWDAAHKAWTTRDPKRLPTLWKANRLFDKEIRKLTSAPKTGLVTFTITWTDPKLAAQWANGLVQMTNAYLRDKAIRESESNIDYLNLEAAKTNVVEVKQAIYSLMKTEINRSMIARGSSEYAFKIIDPATPPELATSPRKPLWLLGGLACGFLLAVLVVLARASFRN